MVSGTFAEKRKGWIRREDFQNDSKKLQYRVSRSSLFLGFSIATSGFYRHLAGKEALLGFLISQMVFLVLGKASSISLLFTSKSVGDGEANPRVMPQ